MQLVVFGLTVSSSWGNGHATLWRGLCRALARAGHRVVFYERDVAYYAQTRDLWALEQGELVLYRTWDEVARRARRDGRGIRRGDRHVLLPGCDRSDPMVEEASRAIRVFYDLDTPVTLARLGAGESVDYVGPDGFAGFDLVLSYTGGRALDVLRDRLGARQALPLYGHVDPDRHREAPARPEFAGALSFLGTYAPDRQAALETLLVEPARCRPEQRFVIGGAQYPDSFPWLPNLYFVRHLPPALHPAFFASSRLTLNVTREAMVDMGWCPSGRLFEAAACGAPIVTDRWAGLEAFFDPGEEILVADGADDVLAALSRSDAELRAMATRARERVLEHHSSARRARELIEALERGRVGARLLVEA